MGDLRSFIINPESRLLVVSACTAKKVSGDLAKHLQPNEKDLDEPSRRKKIEEQLARFRLPAIQMYLGDGHKFVRNAVNVLRGSGYKVSHFILSAGYGLLNENDLIVPYNVTFSGTPKEWIRTRGQKLDLRNQLIQAALKCDQAILILGREYLEALGVPLPIETLPPTLAYVAPSFVNRVGKGVKTISIGPTERKAISAYSSSAKEKKFLLDVQNISKGRTTL